MKLTTAEVFALARLVNEASIGLDGTKVHAAVHIADSAEARHYPHVAEARDRLGDEWVLIVWSEGEPTKVTPSDQTIGAATMAALMGADL